VPAVTLELVGVMETETGAGTAEMLTVALAFLVVSAVHCTLTVTLPPEGTLAGAL
jgi:hypothetical protein